MTVALMALLGGVLAWQALRPQAPVSTLTPADLAAFSIPGQTEEVLRTYLDPGRSGWQLTDRVLETLDLRPGETVLDVGAGSGYFTWMFSREVGWRGRVVALDTDPGAVAFLKRRLDEEPPPFRNVWAFQVTPDDLGLEAAMADCAFLCEAHYYVDAGDAALPSLRSLARALKPGGRVAVIEARSDPGRGRVTVDRLAAPFLKVGLVLAEEHDWLPRQRFVIFRKPAR